MAGLDLAGTDGAVEVLAVDGDDVTVGIVNPDGSRAEMSGNGTRIAAAWLMGRTESEHARVHVGPRTVEVRRIGDGLYESDLGPVELGEREHVDVVCPGAIAIPCALARAFTAQELHHDAR